MKKRFVSAFLVAAMAVTALAGCGGNSGTGSTGGGSAASGTETTGAVSEGGTTTTSTGTYTADNPYHLVFEFIEFYDQDDAARTAVQDALNDYMRENYQIEVEFLPVSFADYQSTTQLMLSGGDELDVLPIMYSYASS